MMAIAIFSIVLVGLGARNDKEGTILLLVPPFILAIAFLLIAEIDSPRGGIIRVVPQNLLILTQSLYAQ